MWWFSFFYFIVFTCTTIKKCGSNLTLLYQFFTKIKMRNNHWQNLNNFLCVVLDKFFVNVGSWKPGHNETKLLRFMSWLNYRCLWIFLRKWTRSNIFLHFTVMSHAHMLSNAHNSHKNQFELVSIGNQRHGNNISFENIVSICVLFLLASSYYHILLFRHIMN